MRSWNHNVPGILQFLRWSNYRCKLLCFTCPGVGFKSSASESFSCCCLIPSSSLLLLTNVSLPQRLFTMSYRGNTSAFAQFAPAQSDANAFQTLALQKLSYIAANFLTVALGIWKCNQMGLIPLGTADWLAFETRGVVSSFTMSWFDLSEIPPGPGDSLIVMIDYTNTCNVALKLLICTVLHVETICNLSLDLWKRNMIQLIRLPKLPRAR